MKKIDKEVVKSILIVLLSLAIFVIILLGYIKIDNYRKASDKIEVKFETSDIVDINNKLPISDEIGKSYNGTGIEEKIEGYSSFSIENNNDRKVNYEIYLTKKTNIDNEIKSNYIKLYLTDENNNPYDGFDQNKIVSYYDLYSLNDKPGSKLLYKGSLVSGGSKKFILRSWVSDTYVISRNEETFNFDIDAKIK